MTDVNRESPSLPPAIVRIDAHVLRWPVTTPVRTSFGTMHDRPAVLVRVEDADGAHGWGEAWCNFPSCGAEHRALLIETVLAPLLVGRAFASAAAAWSELTERTAVLALQAGEAGPIAQAIAGVDIALHDLAARRAGLPLWRHLAGAAAVDTDGGRESAAATHAGSKNATKASTSDLASESATDTATRTAMNAAGGSASDTASATATNGTGAEAIRTTAGVASRRSVRVYASGINPENPGATVEALRRVGYTAFKLKIGFDAARDAANLAAVRAAAGTSALVMADANQAWDLDTAIAMAARLAASAPAWLEEPLRADRPWPEWQRLAAATSIPIAAGENVIGAAGFDALIASKAVAVVQPDLAKWGGVSAVLDVIDRIAAAGLRYCPHYLGAGIGLLASAHVLAARGSREGLLEVDSNENPLRTRLCPPLATLHDGRIDLADSPGLGVEPDLAELRALCAR